jgi:hypothetical protein
VNFVSTVRGSSFTSLDTLRIVVRRHARFRLFGLLAGP